MSFLLLVIIIFIISLLVIELVFYAYRNIMYPDRSKVRQRLRQSMAEESATSGGNILKKEVFSEVPFINRILTLLPGVDRLQLTVNQAKVQYSLGFFILLSMTLGFTGYLFCSFFTKNALVSFPTAFAVASLPLFYVKSKKKREWANLKNSYPKPWD